jgi:hypothetical protein
MAKKARRAQARPEWYLCGLALLSVAVNSTDQCGPSLLPPPDPLEREDCLFLDVFSPKEVFDNRKSGNGTPVMVWIYGGGFAFGKKGGDGDPAGLIARSREVDRNGRGAIYVTFNYRVSFEDIQFDQAGKIHANVPLGRCIRLFIWPKSCSQRHCKRWALGSATCLELGSEIHPPIWR